MNLPRMTVVTLGVSDLARATAFYTALCGRPPLPDYAEVSFFTLPGVWLSLFPADKLAADIDPALTPAGTGFRGFTLAYNARSREEVDALLVAAQAAGGRISKPAQDTFWGGYSGYFTDPDGFQ